MRHFQHCGQYAAFREWETTSQANWQLFDRYLAEAAAAPQAHQHGGPPPPASFAAMLKGSRAGLERVTEMLTVAPAELAAFLDSLAARLSPAAAGRFVASMPEADPLSFQPANIMRALDWLLAVPPFSSMEGAALAAFLPSVRSLLSFGADDLQQRLAALQRTAGLTLEQAGMLVLQEPQVLQTSTIAIEVAATRLREVLPAGTLNALLARQPQLLAASQWRLDALIATLRLWVEEIGVPAEAAVARVHSLERRTPELRQCGTTALRQRLASLQQAAGLTAEAAGGLAAAHPDLLLTPAHALEDAAAWLRQHLPPETFSSVFSPDSQLLSASGSKLEQLRGTLQLWTEVLGTPLATVLQQYQRCFQATRQLAAVEPALLQERLASLQQLAGMGEEAAQAAVVAAPSLLLAPSDRMQASAARLAQLLPPDLLAPLLSSQPQLLASSQWDLDRMAAVVQLWSQLVGVPLATIAASLQHARDAAGWLSAYQPSTLRRRMSALRQATAGFMTGEQLAALVFGHPELLGKQPGLVRDAGAWLQQNLAPDTVR